MIKLGLLDPPEMVPYAKIKEGPAPWTRDENKRLARQVTLEAVVLLKNRNNLLPLDKSRLKSIAVVGQRSNDVAWDWYSGAFPYAVTPLDGIRNKVGPGVKVNFASITKTTRRSKRPRSPMWLSWWSATTRRAMPAGPSASRSATARKASTAGPSTCSPRKSS